MIVCEGTLYNIKLHYHHNFYYLKYSMRTTLLLLPLLLTLLHAQNDVPNY